MMPSGPGVSFGCVGAMGLRGPSTMFATMCAAVLRTRSAGSLAKARAAAQRSWAPSGPREPRSGRAGRW
eukprot:124341-Alexandrium_andersonii.AAC.1